MLIVDDDFTVLYAESKACANGKSEASFGGSDNIMVKGQEMEWVNLKLFQTISRTFQENGPTIFELSSLIQDGDIAGCIVAAIFPAFYSHNCYIS